jgi:predicted extracellular nuclease
VNSACEVVNSKGGDEPLFGRFQPLARVSEIARHAPGQVVNDFVDEILAADPNANIVVLGDIYDFDFSETVEILEGGVLTTLMRTLPLDERYSYVFEGNSQVLDQILVSDHLGHFQSTTTRFTLTPSSPTRLPTTIRRSRASISVGCPGLSSSR